VSAVKTRPKILIGIFSVILLGYLIPERKEIPVAKATSADWNKDTFWYEPWGSSGVHKGIDIFSARGRPVVASTDMVIMYKGNFNKGGNVLLGLGPKWRLHYFAHMESIADDLGIFAAKGVKLGAVGDTGNAKGKQPHLHFSMVSIFPMPWLMDRSTQGYKKAFYLNPIEYFEE